MQPWGIELGELCHPQVRISAESLCGEDSHDKGLVDQVLSPVHMAMHMASRFNFLAE
jgi:hypothetical protein